MAWRKFNGAGHAVVAVEGCLDQAASEEFTAFLTIAAEDAVARGEDLNIDLTELREISSHGLRAIASARNVSKRVTLTCPEGRVREILAISRMDTVFRVEAPKIHLVRATPPSE